MLSIFQLFLAGFAIYGALNYEGEVKLFVPLGCLILMFVVSRLDKHLSENDNSRKSFLKTEIDKVWKKESSAVVKQDFFAIESLVWPKSELLLVDAVHSIFKDLGFKISTGINYHSVDRIVRIPDTEESFGLEMMMSEGQAEQNHPKLSRALQFEKEKRDGEKTLIIASTHTRLPLSEKSKVPNVSRELNDFLVRHHVSFITSHQVYELWQKAKKGEIEIFELFDRIYHHQGGVFPPEGLSNSHLFPFDQPVD